MRNNKARPEPDMPRPVRLGNGLVLLNLIDIALILVVVFVPSNVARTILAVPVLLFFPGYSLLAAIFTRKGELGSVERAVLSSGLSVVIVMLNGLLLNYTRRGIKLELVLYSIGAFVLLTSIIAWVRQVRLAKGERFGITVDLSWPGWGKNIKGQIITVLLLAAIFGALWTLGTMWANPDKGETFTEFYILGQQGITADYPGELKVGDERSVIVGIVNHEGKEVSYSISLVTGNKSSVTGPVLLLDEQNWEEKIGFSAGVPGMDQMVEFLLYKDGEAEPYKELHLWIDVIE